MKIAQGDEVPVVRGASRNRTGTTIRQSLISDDSGAPGCFHLQIAQEIGDFRSPRHHHIFDQFRFVIEGECNFDRDGTMTAGMLGYFPEGAFYGPQISDKPSTIAVVQFGGPSGGGYVDSARSKKAIEELEKIGVFKDGVYHRN